MGQVLSVPGSQGVMRKISLNIKESCASNNIPTLSDLFRYVDDRFFTWYGSMEHFNRYKEICNSFGLKFILDSPPSTTKNFLDITLFIKDRRIELNLYRNPISKSDFYLNYFSYYPNSTKNSIPYSLSLRIIRNCSLTPYQAEAFDELCNALMNNSFYPMEIINNAVERAQSKNRSEILKKQEKSLSESDRTVFVTPYHQTLLSLPYILKEEIDSLKGIDKTFDVIFTNPR